MKSQNLVVLSISIVIAILIAGCGQELKPHLEASTQAINTDSLIATIVSSPSHTTTPLLTGAPTVVPTLSAKQAEKKFVELLLGNGGCHLPCVWGITPGKNTYKEAQATLSPLIGISGLLAGFLPEGGAIFPNYAEDGLKISSSVGFNVETLTEIQVVSRVSFEAKGWRIDGLPVYDSVLFGERLRAYMLPAVLSNHGIPTVVMVSTDGGDGRGEHVPGFYAVLLYPDQGIMAIYTTSRQLIDGTVRGCFANAHVQMYLSPKDQPDAFVEMLAQSQQWGFLWPDPQDSSYWKHIETAASLTLEEFYETFRQETGQCLETPINLWPTPDN